MTPNYALDANGPSPHNVPLGEGPPTKEELLVYYPAIFTWKQLKTVVNFGPRERGVLKRNKDFQRRYDRWAEGIKAEYGSNENYLIKYRLQWGKTDTISKLPFRLSPPVVTLEKDDDGTERVPLLASGLPPIPPDTKPYFTANIPLQLVSIIMNDWPYSVPSFIEHYVIWTVVPIFPHDLPSIIKARLHQDGSRGFTGYTPDSPPPSPSLFIPTCLPVLSDWSITEESLVRTSRRTEEEDIAVREAGLEVHKFIIATWREREWETAWHVNPPRLGSVPTLAHIHVFARYKSAEERNAWDSKTS